MSLTDKELLDKVRETFALKSYGEVADFLGVTNSMISEARKDDGSARPLSAWVRLKAFDHLGYHWARDALLNAFPEKTKKILIELDNARARRIALEHETSRSNIEIAQ